MFIKRKQSIDNIAAQDIATRQRSQTLSACDSLINSLQDFNPSDNSDDQAQVSDDQVQLEQLFVVLSLGSNDLFELKKIQNVSFPNPEEWKPSATSTNDGLDGDIQAASFVQLILYVTSPELSNVGFTRRFLFSSPSFTSPTFLLGAFFARYYTDISNPGSNITTKEELKKVRLRIIRLIQEWITSLPYQFNTNMIKALEQFKSDLQNEGQTTLVSILDASIRKFYGMKDDVTLTKEPAPPPILPTTPVESWTIEDIDPLELARQITLQQFETFRSIGPMELLTGIWGTTKGGGSPNIDLLVKNFDKLNSYVTNSILSAPDPKARAKVFEKWLKVALHFQEMVNFNGTFAVILGLITKPISRLHKTMKNVSKSQRKQLEELSSLCDIQGDYKNYRPIINQITDRCVPFIGCFQKDLVYVQESFPNKIGDLINFKKCNECLVLIEKIQKLHNRVYPFEKNDRIQDIINALPEPKDTLDFMRTSLELEPPK